MKGHRVLLGAKAAAAADKEGTRKWRAALVAARPHIPLATATGRQRRRKLANHKDEELDVDEVVDLEDPMVAEGPLQAAEGSDDDKYDDAGVYVHLYPLVSPRDCNKICTVFEGALWCCGSRLHSFATLCFNAQCGCCRQ